MNQSFKIENLSTCNDTVDLMNALKQIEESKQRSKEDLIEVNVGEAGTSYRFLTALLATLSGNFCLTGSEKLMKRPMTALIDALDSLGANIKPTHQQGPLIIKGAKIKGGSISLDASTSSQFITSLLLVAPYFSEGLTIELKGKIVSVDYIRMTIELMKLFGASVNFQGNFIQVDYCPYNTNVEKYSIESDWTAASYWYAMAVLSKESNIYLKGLKQQSLQGDSIIPALFSIYGLISKFDDGGVTITKGQHNGFIHAYDFSDQPDLVQTFAFLNAALDLPLQVNNASNLVHKETDRITAIANEIKKIGGLLTLHSNDDFSIETKVTPVKQETIFETYSDHRMAMSAAMLGLTNDRVKIAHENVVAKSYPAFWEHLAQAGFEVIIDK